MEQAGVKREQIHVHAGRTSGAKESTQHEGGFSGWMKSLFGEDETRYSTAYEGGNTIVAVDTTNDKIDFVADILDRNNPRSGAEDPPRLPPPGLDRRGNGRPRP